VDEFQMFLARINCVLDQAAAELEVDDYHALLVLIESELFERLDQDDGDGEDGDPESESEGGGQEDAG
jgi:hypothetical protein